MSEHPIYQAQRVELAKLFAYLQERLAASREERSAAAAGEFAHHYPDLARRAADQVMPSTKLPR